MKCEYPGCDADEPLLFVCKYCGHSFCERHRLPEAHNCPSLRNPNAVPQYIYAPKYQPPNSQYVPPTSFTPEQFVQQFLDEKTKKELIERKLFSSGELFSLGNEILDLILGFSIIVIVFGFYQVIVDHNWWGFLTAVLLVGTAFVPHELAHKFVAIRKGQFARYVLWVKGMMLTLLTLFIGIGLIVPGFVAIIPLSRRMNKKDMGLVSFAGPATNTVIGAFTLIFALLTHFAIIPFGGPLSSPNIFFQITQFNGLIALFNCIPVWQLDGAKIIKWNKWVFFGLIVLNVALIVPSFIYNPTVL